VAGVHSVGVCIRQVWLYDDGQVWAAGTRRAWVSNDVTNDDIGIVHGCLTSSEWRVELLYL